MSNGWLNRPVFSNSLSHSSFCLPCPLRTYGWSSHRTCTSTCAQRPRCLGLTWAHLLPFSLKSWLLISDFKASSLIGKTFKVFICPRMPTFQKALVGLYFIFSFGWFEFGDMRELGKQGEELPRCLAPLTMDCTITWSSLWKLKPDLLKALMNVACAAGGNWLERKTKGN